MQAARLTHYEMLEQDIDGAILQIGAEPHAGEWPTTAGEGVSGSVRDPEAQLLLTMGSAVPTAVQRRVQQSLSLARKCAPSRLRSLPPRVAGVKLHSHTQCNYQGGAWSILIYQGDTATRQVVGRADQVNCNIPKRLPVHLMQFYIL